MAYPSLNDVQLINLLSKDDEAAFEEIYKRYARELAAFAGPRLYNLEDARDIIHDLFVKLWEDRQDLVIASNLQTYLFSITRHRVVERIRRHIAREEYADMIQPLAKGRRAGKDKKLSAKEQQKQTERSLHAYLEDEASANEVDRVEAWLNSARARNSGWQQLDQKSREEWLNDLFIQIQDSIAGRKSRSAKIRSRRYLLLGITGAAALFVIILAIYQFWPSTPHYADPRSLSTLTVPPGQIKQITLADSSSVWVNEGSELKYPAQFDRGKREVYLSGEAYFDIRYDPSRPFVIHTGRIVTTVPASALNIREDKTLHTILITVTRGKASVSNGGNQLATLNASQQLRFNLLSNSFAQSAIDARPVIAWQQNELIFNNMTLGEVATVLERRFKAQIIFDNEKLKNCRFTGSFIRGEKLDKILKDICSTNHATYETGADGAVVISGAGCNAK